jgi:farnesyl-diphosphate farnesyltransferase
MVHNPHFPSGHGLRPAAHRTGCDPPMRLPSDVESAEGFCRAALPEVSRTFALNIPLLPAPLDLAVTAAYLLCRIADTLEDESVASAAERRPLMDEFARLCELPADWPLAAERFAATAVAALRPAAPAAEVRLVRGTGRVLETVAALPSWVRTHVARCVREMTAGMALVLERVEKQGHSSGLVDLNETLTYCYFVAGTVGEMLTGLFAGYSPSVAKHLPELESRAAAFGRALQLTNILKDIREDRERGSCWLPRTLMARHGLTADNLLAHDHRAAALELLDELLAVAHREVETSFEYILLLPAEEKGIRLFCLWPLFFAVLTLRELRGNPEVFSGPPVKISRAAVKRVMVFTRALVDRDWALRVAFRTYTAGLPMPAA